MKGMFL